MEYMSHTASYGPSCGNYFLSQRLTDLVGKYRPQSSAHHHLSRTKLLTKLWGGEPHGRQKASSGLSISLRHWVPEPESLRRFLRRLVMVRRRSPGSSFKRRRWKISKPRSPSQSLQRERAPPAQDPGLGWSASPPRAIGSSFFYRRTERPASTPARQQAWLLEVGSGRADE
jgi:hypothetical protein